MLLDEESVTFTAMDHQFQGVEFPIQRHSMSPLALGIQTPFNAAQANVTSDQYVEFKTDELDAS